MDEIILIPLNNEKTKEQFIKELEDKNILLENILIDLKKKSKEIIKNKNQRIKELKNEIICKTNYITELEEENSAIYTKLKTYDTINKGIDSFTNFLNNISQIGKSFGFNIK